MEQNANVSEFCLDGLFPAAIEEIAIPKRPETMLCPGCKRTLPFVPSVFPVDHSSPTGHSETCQSCRIKEQQELIDACVAEANLVVDLEIHKRIGDLSRRTSSEDQGVPHVKTLFQRLSEAFGGPEGLAAAHAATYAAAKPGSAQRVGVLKLADSMAIEVTRSGGADVDLAQMTPDELRELRSQVEKRVKSLSVTESAGEPQAQGAA